MIALGLEGSANKLGIGVISHPPDGKPALVLANIRHTFVRPIDISFSNEFIAHTDVTYR